MTRIEFNILLEEPLLATRPTADSTTETSYPYIPGSLIRGALIGRYLRTRETSDFAGSAEARRLFFDGNTRYRNAYLTDGTGVVAPTRKDLWTNQEKALIWGGGPDGQPDAKRVSDPFLGEATGGAVFAMSPERTLRIHTRRNRAAGRSTSRDGALFQYDALSPGQVFRASVDVDSAESASTLMDLLAGSSTTHLGGSRGSGYGRVTLTDIKQVSRATPDLGKRLRLTLQSPALITSPMGDPSVDPGDFARCVSKVLGVKVDVVSMTVRYEITGGFNRKWGLPLPQWTAFSGGSTFLIDCAEKPSAQRQLTLVATGVGERQAEGFGECRLESGLPFRRTIVSTPEELGERADLLGADSEVQSIAFRMLGRKLRVDLDRRLKRQAIRLAGEIRNRPSNSQFAGLRSAALQALHLDMAAGRQVIGVHAAGLSDVEMVRQSYARCRIDGIRFLTWLTDRIEDDATEVGTGIWGILGVSLPSLGGLQAQPSRELGFEYNMRLVHEVLRLAMKGEGVKT